MDAANPHPAHMYESKQFAAGSQNRIWLIIVIVADSLFVADSRSLIWVFVESWPRSWLTAAMFNDGSKK